LPGCARRNLEVYATVIVGFAGSWEIEVGEENLVGAARAEVKERIAHDGVVEHVGLVAVFENEHGRGLSGHGLFCLVGSVSFRSRIAVGGAFGGRICVPRARSVDVVDVE
jgi:hypothetical protein